MALPRFDPDRCTGETTGLDECSTASGMPRESNLDLRDAAREATGDARIMEGRLSTAAVSFLKGHSWVVWSSSGASSALPSGRSHSADGAHLVEGVRAGA